MSEPAQKCENNAIFKQNSALELFISLKMAISCYFCLRGNLDFSDFLQIKFYNINYWQKSFILLVQGSSPKSFCLHHASVWPVVSPAWHCLIQDEFRSSWKFERQVEAVSKGIKKLYPTVLIVLNGTYEAYDLWHLDLLKSWKGLKQVLQF